MPSLFDEPDPGETPAPNPAPREEKGRLETVLESHSVKARLTIDICKPIALAVATANGKVTAATFRAEAEKRNKLPATNGDQRALSWIPAMFAELCREGFLAKKKRADGSVVREYSKGQTNDQVVYVPGTRPWR